MEERQIDNMRSSTKLPVCNTELDSGPPDPTPGDNLKLRHQKFIESYLANGGNATQAAKAAGYSPNPGSLRTLASWLLKKPEIQERIRTRLLVGARVQTDEILGVLAHRMRTNLMDVIDDDGQVDLQAVREFGLGHAVKKITIVKKANRKRGDLADSQAQERPQMVRLELQSPSDAANHLARLLRKDTARSRKSDRDRLVQNLRDLFDEAALQAQQAEP